jgi:hypothetical protein
MKRYKTILIRGSKGFLSQHSLGTDGLNAIVSIPFTKDVKIENESNDEVEISYLWTGPEEFWDTDQYLSKHGVMKKR